ncbi:putative membrane protein [Amorphus suaedae]
MQRLPRHLLPALGAICVLIAATIGMAAPAAADLRLCNKTDDQVGVAVGYKNAENWVSEGWWNLPAQSCEVLLEGPLSARFYYLYALDYVQGGEWAGSAFMCTREKEFTITGIEDCLARGYERTGFVEIDTGEQSSWTVHLTERSRSGMGGR